MTMISVMIIVYYTPSVQNIVNYDHNYMFESYTFHGIGIIDPGRRHWIFV